MKYNTSFRFDLRETIIWVVEMYLYMAQDTIKYRDTNLVSLWNCAVLTCAMSIVDQSVMQWCLYLAIFSLIFTDTLIMNKDVCVSFLLNGFYLYDGI